jgi:hypothetical protein
MDLRKIILQRQNFVLTGSHQKINIAFFKINGNTAKANPTPRLHGDPS